MPYKSPTLIAELMKDVLNTAPYYDQWLTSKIMKACKLALPFAESSIQQLYIKKDTLYIQLDSTLLSHELRLNKTSLIKRLQNACKALGEDIILQNVVFL